MFVHSVYFWLRDDLAAAERDTFLAGIASLRAIEGVRQSFSGAPAPTDRAVIERGYTHAMILVFPDAATEAAYQVHPVHDTFRETCGSFWTQVRVFDTIAD